MNTTPTAKGQQATLDTASNLPAVITSHHTIAAAVDSSSALGDFDDLDLSPDDAALPLLAMNRKVGQDDSGVLVGNERVLELDFIWAAKSISRAHFPQAYDKDPNGRPDCHSIDGINPSPIIAQPKAKTCAGCPWSFEATGGNEGPDGSPGCSKNLEALIYLSDGDMNRVARIRFSGIAFKAARAYWDSFRFARPKKYAFQFLTRMRLVSTKTDNGNFLVPEFTRIETLTDDEALAVGHDAKALTGTFRSLTADDIVTAGARETESGPGPFDDTPTTHIEGVGDVASSTGEIVRPVANTPGPFDFSSVGKGYQSGEEPF